MDPDLAKLAVRFLLRVHLTGEEVPAFNAVMAALSQVVDGMEGTEPARPPDETVAAE